MTDRTKARTPFHMRGLTSFIVTWSFLIVLATGCVMYATPQGRVAHWTGWTFLGLGKEECSGVHMVASIAFIVAAGFHLYFNWGIFASYFKTKMRSGFNLKREFAVATVLTLAVLGGTILNIPPFGLVARWNEDIKVYWEARSMPGPYAHAEESSLAEICNAIDMPLENAVARLDENGIDVPNASIRINHLAEQHNMTPSALFALIGADQVSHAGDTVEGLGRLTLEALCAQEGMEVDEAIAALARQGIAVAADDRMKSVATRSDRTPREVLAIIRARATGKG